MPEQEVKSEHDELMEEIWPRETKNLLRFEVKVGDCVVPLPITQDLMGRRWEYAIGNIVWDAAVAMHRYFQTQFEAGHFRGKSVLELGSGTGLVGLTLAILGANLVMTDVSNVLELLRHNLDACIPASSSSSSAETSAASSVSSSAQPSHPAELSSSTVASAATVEASSGGGSSSYGSVGMCEQRPIIEPLTWGEPVPEGRRRVYDYVVGSDITYNRDACADLLKTLREVCGPETDVYIGHLERGDEDAFFSDLSSDFDVQRVYNENVAEDGVAKSLWVHVFHAKRKRRIGC